MPCSMTQPVLHDQNDIGTLNGGEAVSDDEARAPFHHLSEGFLNLQLGARVNGGGRFVKNQHRRQTEHDARDAQQLLLSLRKLSAGFADDGVVALRKPLDEAVRVAGFGGGDNLLLRRVRLAHGDVLANRTGRKPSVLQDHADILAQILGASGGAFRVRRC